MGPNPYDYALNVQIPQQTIALLVQGLGNYHQEHKEILQKIEEASNLSMSGDVNSAQAILNV